MHGSDASSVGGSVGQQRFTAACVAGLWVCDADTHMARVCRYGQDAAADLWAQKCEYAAREQRREQHEIASIRKMTS